MNMDASKLSLMRRQFRPDRSVRWRGALIISIPVICLFASIFAIAGLRSKTIEAREQQDRSQRTLVEIERLLKTLVDAETGIRGYVITRRPEFLQAYLEAKTQLPQSLTSVRAKVGANSTQPQQMEEIPTLLQQQIGFLEQILQTSNLQGESAGGSPTMTALLLNSRANMEELRQEIDRFAEKEKRAARDREVESVRWRHLTTLVQWSALGIGMVASGGAVYLFNQIDRELQERESRLRESNLFLRSVFNSVVDGILILDERGYIQAANTAALNIFGYESADICGKHLQRLIAGVFTEDSGQAMRSLVGADRGKLRLQQEVIGCCQDGKTFPMEFAISQMQLNNESLYIVLVRDITERKRSQETLLKQAQLLDLANDTIIVRDLNDMITYWNQGAERLYGFSSAEALGQTINSLLHTEFPQPREEIKAAVLKAGHWSGELIHYRYDGSPVAVKSGWTLQRDENGEPIAYLEINQDISERKRSEAALRHSEELYRTLVKNFPNGAVFLFDRDLRYTIAEGTGLATVNLNSEALTGKTIWDTLPPETAQLLEPIYQDALAGKSTVMEMPFGDRLYRVHVLPVINEDGAILSGMTMTQDITESKKAEEALRSRADELARLTTILATTTTNLEKRNAELDQFAYIVSHDLKAPLRAIANLSQWLEEDLEQHLTEDTRYQMDLLRTRVHRMEALINGLLQYSRVGRLRTALEVVDVEALIAEVVDSLAPPPEFTVTISSGMPTLWTERLPLEQVFANLISNAIKHNHRADGRVTISSHEQIDDYEFIVSDNGPGIAPEFHEKVFIMFQTLEPRDKVENTGVGLAIVKKIIEEQGGRITLESNRDQGATFRFTWPKHIGRGD